MPLNPTADSDYLSTAQDRADFQTARNFVMNTEALPADQKNAALVTNGLTPEMYTRFKQNVGFPVSAEEAAAQQKAVEGSSQNIEAMRLGRDPITAPVMAAAGLPMAAESGIASALGGTAAANEAVGEIQDLAKKLLPTHPAAANLIGTLAGVGALGGVGAIGGMEGGAEGAAEEAVSPVGETAPAGATGTAAESATQSPLAKQVGVATKAFVGPQADPEELQDFAQQRLAAMQEATRGNAYNAETQQMTRRTMSSEQFEAENQPLTEKDVQAMPPGTPRLASQNVALSNFTYKYATDLYDAAYKAISSNDPADKAAVTQKFIQLALQYEPKLQGALIESGRSVNILKDPTLGQNNFIRQFTQLFDSLGDAGLTHDHIVNAIAALKSPEETNILAEQMAASGIGDATKGTGWEAFRNIYVSSLLSFNSVGKKAVSDVANMLWQIPANALGEAGSRISELATGAEYGTKGILPGETVAMTKAMVKAIPEALGYGWNSIKANAPMFESDVGFLDNLPMRSRLSQGTRWESTGVGRALDWYGHLISAPGRGIVGVDQFSKVMQYRMELGALAQRQGMQDALEEGLTGTDLSARAAQLAQGYMRNPTHEMIAGAMDTAKTNTFTQDLEGSLAKLDAFRRSNFATRTLVPFFKTPTNIVLQGIRQSPLAPLSPTWRGAVQEGGREGALALSKAAMGSLVMAYLMHHALEGRLTGKGPDDPDINKMWGRDNEPYSVKVGNKWIPYGGAEPWAWLAGLAADSAPMFSYLEAGDASHAAGILANAAVKEIDRQSMWGALHTLAGALDDAEKGRVAKAERFFGGITGGFVPSTLANFAGYQDPIRRQTLAAMDEIRNRIPWLKDKGVATRDAFGDKVVVPPGFVFNEFPAFKVVDKGNPDPAVDELVRLNKTTGFTPPRIPNAIGGPYDAGNLNDPTQKAYGAQLTPEEAGRWSELRGNPGFGLPKLRDRVADIIESPKYKELGDAGKASELHATWLSYQQAAEARMYQEIPDLKARVQGALVGKAQAFMGRSGAAPAPATP